MLLTPAAAMLWPCLAHPLVKEVVWEKGICSWTTQAQKVIKTGIQCELDLPLEENSFHRF